MDSLSWERRHRPEVRVSPAPTPDRPDLSLSPNLLGWEWLCQGEVALWLPFSKQTFPQLTSHCLAPRSKPLKEAQKVAHSLLCTHNSRNCSQIQVG